MSRMHNPPHPGEVLEGLYLTPTGITIKDLAEHMDVDRKTVSRIINGKTSVTTEMALRLAKALNTSPELWINVQNQYDLYQAQKRRGRKFIDLSRVKPLLN